MGIDFLERFKKTINAGYDRRRYDLAREDLLTRHPECARYAGRMKLRPGVTVEPGDDVLVEERNGWMFASRGMEVLGDFREPPAAMRDAVHDHGGKMLGTIDSVMEFSGAAEVVLCP
jgi:hypothetical protein